MKKYTKEMARLHELEELALSLITGEEIEQTLDAHDPKLAKEYRKLMGWDE